MERADIIHESENYFIVKATKGFSLYRKSFSHLTLCSKISVEGKEGFQRTLKELKRREKTERDPGYEANPLKNIV